MLYGQPLVAWDLPRAPQPWAGSPGAETACLPKVLVDGPLLWSLASPPTSPTPRVPQGAGHQKTFPGSQSAPVTVRSPQDWGPSGPQDRRPPEEAKGDRLGMHASQWLCVDICPQRPVHAWRRGPGEGSLVSPRMICHCLMRLMSPGGWYAAVLGHSLEADAHGNDGKGRGGLGVECFSPARWFPLICGRGHEQGRLARPPPLPIPTCTGEECKRETADAGGS